MLAMQAETGPGSESTDHTVGLSSMLAMLAETGPGSAFSRFPRGGSEVSFSSPALS